MKLQQRVTVTVTEVDINRKRIALTMKTAGGDRPASNTERRPANKPAASSNKKPEPLNAFQAKLMELKKKFDD